MKKLITICVVVGLLLIVSANVKGAMDPCLLLHFDGTDGQTTTVDSSGQGHSISLFNGAKLDTSTKAPVVGGTASLLLDGSNDYGTLLSSPDWDIFASNTDSWTTDFYVKHDTLPGNQVYLSRWEPPRWLMSYEGGLELWGNFGPVLSPAGAISDSEWHWIAFCKVGDKYALYKDGQQVNYTQNSGTATINAPLYIGCYLESAGFFDGHMDELRIFHANVFDANPSSGLTDTIIYIPEPATIGLLGLGALSLLRRKRRAKLN
ncbi:MAG: LamG domain-containing protein [Sedimentisphaerales bacterium]|nr:LamG domain-containing protein [Sedimentisphaerales bacterium]